MATIRSPLIFSKTVLAPASPETFTIPWREKSSRRTVWILATDENVNVAFRMKSPSDEGGDDFPIQNKQGPTLITKDRWFPDTDEDLGVGELLVVVTPVGPSPTKVVVLVTELTHS